MSRILIDDRYSYRDICPAASASDRDGCLGGGMNWVWIRLGLELTSLRYEYQTLRIAAPFGKHHDYHYHMYIS